MDGIDRVISTNMEKYAMGTCVRGEGLASMHNAVMYAQIYALSLVAMSYDLSDSCTGDVQFLATSSVPLKSQQHLPQCRVS